MSVYIAQLKCPADHCIIAAYGEFASDAEASVLAYRLGEKSKSLWNGIPAPCGLCGGAEFYVEVGKTRFNTMEEAEPVIRRLELQQSETALRVRELLHQMRHGENSEHAVTISSGPSINSQRDAVSKFLDGLIAQS